MEYIGFVKAMDALKGMKLMRKMKEGKAYTAEIKVDFDRTKHLSNKSIRKRERERQRLIQLEKERAEQKMKEKEEEDRKREEERKQKELEELERKRKKQDRLTRKNRGNR
ncbi:putative A-kinase anchor protein 17A [Apostichopus japonicus]|uniref:Putative A-kinase anchor protein 17A n=1 Tax=Stichopus japonicus TaxID=307972 RepID=A0A2G8KCV6_STIJA|nr:putative A-kinase anchor protein 17A [Apostichopus japonicus]